ncbi:hypothetical protein A1O3_02905 [Capronia epimyces CBS 606.96]|uniref:Isopenicillin N synthase-like Fe(2+) 2OG dioxygenase domain-containing protein n=1 Tax=Capronia epimyces CBS 606.96 TaxID=1182542 RepID=W9YBI2_9EURO|nr:uncharacterized protein A1O3_02905 [Capronia epimyces CBS 606.96]EXJ89838.1 hypothetical protein A1O3_02905 [Capronia epimyces CBS 606.96]
MAPPPPPKFTHASPITVSLHDLRRDTVPFSTLLAAFGPDSLGILVVTDLPGEFARLRSKVLSDASRLAALPREKLQQLTNPAAKYLVGWSHGVETLRPGVVDTAKGSYYVNCAFYQDRNKNQDQNQDKNQNQNQPTTGQLSSPPGFEEYTSPNMWPEESDLPRFQADVEALITLIIDTAVLVARACDRFAAAQAIPGYQDGYLERVVRGSTTTKARLLHYFPIDSSDQNGTEDRNRNHEPITRTKINEPEQRPNNTNSSNNSNNNSSSSSNNNRIKNNNNNDVEAGLAEPAAEEGEGNDEIADTWCTTHLDHGCLTGLTSAMFVDEGAVAAGSVSQEAAEEEEPNVEAAAEEEPERTADLAQPSPLTELPSSPDPSSGLYVLSRTGQICKVSIPRDCLAFQTGEALELITRGQFKAVPHFVKGVDPSKSQSRIKSKIARNTLAVFTQPNLHELVDAETGLTFGEFARGVVKKNTAG